jgi:hypothetical protein
MGVAGVMRTGTKAVAFRSDDSDRMGMTRSSIYFLNDGKSMQSHLTLYII